MKRSEADIKAKEIFEEWADRSIKIFENAKKQERLKAGLDANNELTAALDEEMKTRLMKLAEEVEEEENE